MSINVVVVAVIALIILVVLVVIFVRNIGVFSDGTSQCSGACVTIADQCSADGSNTIATPMACKLPSGEAGKYCCLKVGQ